MNMETAPGDEPSDQAIDEIVAALRARVDQRRQDGEYPLELDAQLEEHFRRIAFHRHELRKAAMERVVDRVANAHAKSELTRPEFASVSTRPGDRIIRQSIFNVVEPNFMRMYEEMQTFAIAVRESLHELEVAMQNGFTHSHADLIGQLDAFAERVDHVERQIESLQQRDA